MNRFLAGLGIGYLIILVYRAGQVGQTIVEQTPIGR